jgi:3',5'-cyclic AMP phosphodiesterase CpdA
MNIVHFSDPHIMAEGLLHGVIDTGKTFSAALKGLSESGKKVDLVVVSGDLANSGESEAYEKLYFTLENLVSALGCALLAVPGNHDNRKNFSAVFPGVQNGITGRMDQQLELGDWQFIGLDTLAEGHDYGEMTLSQAEWLENVLRNSTSRHSALVMHHPPIDSPTVGMSKIGFRNKDLLSSALAAGNVRFILAGHYHHFVFSDFCGAKVIVASSTAYQIDPMSPEDFLRGYQGIGFNFMTLTDEGNCHLSQVNKSYPLSSPVLDAPIAELGISIY